MDKSTYIDSVAFFNRTELLYSFSADSIWNSRNSVSLEKTYDGYKYYGDKKLISIDSGKCYLFIRSKGLNNDYYYETYFEFSRATGTVTVMSEGRPFP